jgi:predicted CopG family antitoxin
VAQKRTIPIDDAVYEGLHRVVGRGGISKFIENLARPHVAQRDLGAQYREAARDAAREREAQAWSEGLAGGVDEAR